MALPDTSGSTRKYPEKAKIFFEEIFKGLGKNPKFLICYFTLPREFWEENFSKDIIDFPNFFPKEINSVIEMALPDTFEVQVKNSDIIYIKGGDDYLIKFWLSQFDIPKIWEGKVVVTSSASSNILSKHFWTCDWRKNMDGLDILPIKFLPHFNSDYGNNDPRGPIDWAKSYKALEEYGDKTLPIYALEEGDFIVVEK
jgi:hypothetical protein